MYLYGTRWPIVPKVSISKRDGSVHSTLPLYFTPSGSRVRKTSPCGLTSTMYQSSPGRSVSQNDTHLSSGDQVSSPISRLGNVPVARSKTGYTALSSLNINEIG